MVTVTEPRTEQAIAAYFDADGRPDTIKARVFVLYTGGTIGMRPIDPLNPDSPLVPASKDDLLESMPRLGKQEGIHWDIEPLTIDGESTLLDSSDVEAIHWIHMAKAIESVYDQYDGFVILHGTDTMAYTASGLSFLMENLAKPVIITGSQLPIAATRTDGVQNFVNALHIAAHKATGLPCVPEVAVCFNNSLLRGNRTRKVSTTKWEGFDSPNYPKLGTIGEHIQINTDVVRAAPDNEKYPFFVHNTLETNVMDIGLFPGLQPTHLSAILNATNLKGIVLRTFGCGNAPSKPEFLNAINDACRDDVVVLNVTQCTEGLVEMGA